MLQKIDDNPGEQLSAAAPDQEKINRGLRLLRLSRRPHVQVAIYCTLLFCAALALDLYRLGSPSLWFDEILSVTRAQQPLSVVLRIDFKTQPNMALYYVLLHFWLQFTSLFGLRPTEFVVRFPSAIFAACGTVMVYLLGWRFTGKLAGVIAAALYLLNNLQMVYAQEARSYSLQLFLICLSWYAIFVIATTEKPAKRWWLCLAIVSVLAVYTQIFSMLIVLAQGLVIGSMLLVPGPWRPKMRGQVGALATSVIAFGVLLIPILIASRTGSKTGWLPIPHLVDIYHLFLTIGNNSKIYLSLTVLFIILGVVAVALALLTPTESPLSRLVNLANTRLKDKNAAPRIFLVAISLVLWLVVPVLSSYLISQKSVHLFSSRYLVVIVPPFFLLVGLGATIARRRLVRVLLCLVLLALAIHYVPSYYASAQVENWRSAAQWLQTQYQPHDGLVCYDNSEGCQVGMQYYLTTYPEDGDGAIDFDSDSPGAFNWIDYDLTNKLGNYRAAVDPDELEKYAAKHPRLFFVTARASANDARLKTARAWLDSHYTFLKQMSSGTVTIRLYQTG